MHQTPAPAQQGPALPSDLDIEQPAQLLDYLRRTDRVDRREQPTVRVLAGGVSNRTVLVERPGGQSWVIKQALEQLRVPHDWHSSPMRIHREAMGLRWLAGVLPAGAVPSLVFEDDEHHLLAMSAVPQPHENWKALLLAGRVDTPFVETFARMLAAIHRAGYEQRGQTARTFADRSFFESLRLEPYYLFTAEQVPEASPFLRDLVDRTRARGLTVVHGDYSPKNILVHAGRLVLLDHEVIHWGDAAFDVGFSLTHLLSKAHHLPAHRQAFADASLHYWNTYRQDLGEVPWAGDLEHHAVRHTLGCLLARVAGRSQLEYMDAAEKARQRDAVVSILHDLPAALSDLVAALLERL